MSVVCRLCRYPSKFTYENAQKYFGKRMNADNNTKNIILISVSGLMSLEWFKVAIFGKMEDFFHFEPPRTLNN